MSKRRMYWVSFVGVVVLAMGVSTAALARADDGGSPNRMVSSEVHEQGGFIKLQAVSIYQDPLVRELFSPTQSDNGLSVTDIEVENIRNLESDKVLAEEQTTYKRCYPNDAADPDIAKDCDRDEDGFIDRECKKEAVATICQGNEDVCLQCAAGYKLSTGFEQSYCDAYDATKNDLLSRSYITPGTLNYAQIRPDQSEVPFDGIDNDCDSYVDETEFVYKQYGNNVSDHGFDVEIVVNDWMHILYATKVIAVVYDIGDVNEDDIAAIQRALYLENIPIAILRPDLSISPKVTDIFIANYPYYQRWDKRAANNNLSMHLSSDRLEAGRVYAVGILFFGRELDTRRTPILFNCVDTSSSSPWPSYQSSCAARDRIYTDVYVSATGVSTDESRLRAYVVNRALYERNLSDRGLVGRQGTFAWPYNPIEDLLLPNGKYPVDNTDEVTRKLNGMHYDADFHEAWCSEFVVSVYDWSTEPDPNASEINPDLHYWNQTKNLGPGNEFAGNGMKEYFSATGNLYETNVEFHIEHDAKLGDYLAIDGDEPEKSSATDGDVDHSLFFLSIYHRVPGVDPGDREPQIWVVDGNVREKQVLFRTFTLEGPWSGYWNALGYLEDEKPIVLP